MKIKGLPIVVCHKEEYEKLIEFPDRKKIQRSTDGLISQTLQEVVAEAAQLIEDQLKNGEQVYLFVGNFMTDEGTFVRLWWRNNFHWEIVGKELTAEEVDVLRPHWAGGYEYGKGCICDEKEKIK